MGIIDVSAGVRYLQEHGIPVYRFPEQAAKAFGAIYRYSQWMNRQHLAQFPLAHDTQKAETLIQGWLSAGTTRLGELEGNELLKCYGFDVLPTMLAQDSAAAAEIADRMGYPVVAKIVSPQILHKSDANGVAVGLDSPEAVAAAFDQITVSARAYSPDAEIRGVLIQKMAPEGREIIIGMNRYPVFGPLLMFGLGGVFVEIFHDVVFRMAPIGRNEARRMIRSIRGYNMLRSFRGRPKADVDVLEKIMVCLSDLSMNHPEIKEMDINPLLVHEEGRGATVADCRIILEPKPAPNTGKAQ